MNQEGLSVWNAFTYSVIHDQYHNVIYRTLTVA